MAVLGDDPPHDHEGALADRTGELDPEQTVHLGRLDGADVIYTAKRESVHPLRMHSAVGRRLPAYSTSLGRAILADQPIEVRERLIPASIDKITPHTTTDRDALLALIAEAEINGYARESEESCMGVRCFGVTLPFFGGTDALSVAIPISRLGGGREDFVVETLLSVKGRLAAVRSNSLAR